MTNITLMGLGRQGGGIGAARFLAQQGALVTVTDLADEAALAGSLGQLADVPIHRFHLGGHREEDFTGGPGGAEMLVVNPAVRLDHPLVERARATGVAITSEMEIFLRLCPAQIVGVTGTNGKSTTAAMTEAILKADDRRGWLGGNIGRSLLPELDRIAPDDSVVLELSSFQLAWLGPDAPLPEIAVVTNWSPNHLDWHGNEMEYRAAKQRLLRTPAPNPSSGRPPASRLRPPAYLAILNPHDPDVRGWSAVSQRKVVAPVPLETLPPLRLPGRHNLENAACAAAAALAAGCSRDAVQRGLAAYTGLPHRLEPVGQVHGRQFYNDSMATTPGSVVAALEALEAPVWLLAGGLDQGVALDEMTGAIVRQARGACFYGAARERLLRETQAAAHRGVPTASTQLHATETLAEAFAWCWQRSQPGDAIVLSPGCSSYDQFRDYRHRAETFIRCVDGLTLLGNREREL